MEKLFVDCIYYTKYGDCNHLDRGRGFLFRGRPCVLQQEFVGSCLKIIRLPRPKGPPPHP